MADFTLQEAADRLSTLSDRICKQCVDVMKSETPQGRTKRLYNSIHSEPVGRDQYFIGTDVEYASWVENGRGAVHSKKTAYDIGTRKPRRVALRYLEYTPGPKSIHTPIPGYKPGDAVYRYSTGPAPANPFVKRSYDRIDKMHFSL